MREMPQETRWKVLGRQTAYIALSTGAKAALVMFVFVATVLFGNLLQYL
jgi:hypothetical protein